MSAPLTPHLMLQRCQQHPDCPVGSGTRRYCCGLRQSDLPRDTFNYEKAFYLCHELTFALQHTLHTDVQFVSSYQDVKWA